MSKRGLLTRLFVHNQTLTTVKMQLPQENPVGRKAGDAIAYDRGLCAQADNPACAQLVSRAGTPTAVHPAGISLSTTEPAPILAKSPTLTSPRMVVPELSRTPRPILGARPGSACLRPMVTFCMIVTSSPMTASEPMMIPVA